MLERHPNSDIRRSAVGYVTLTSNHVRLSVRSGRSQVAAYGNARPLADIVTCILRRRVTSASYTSRLLPNRLGGLDADIQFAKPR